MTRVGSLCSGYGGLDAAVATVLGGHVAWHAEIDPAAAAVLATHHPDVPNLGDITAADFTCAEQIDVVCAGYPCQPLSLAGRRTGTADERWIWPHVLRAVRVLRPRLVVLENTPGHLSLGFGRVVGDLASIGYVGSWLCVRASDVGAPHRRERVFILARPAADPDSGAVRIGAVRFGTRREQAESGDDRPCGGVTLLPTPGARLGDPRRGTPGVETATRRLSDEGRRNLDDTVALLPTPAARDAGRGAGWGDQPGRPLSETVHRLMPTPRASDGDAGHRRGEGSANLRTEVMLLPTPTAALANRHGGPSPETVQHRTAVDGSGGFDLRIAAGDGDRWGQYADAIARWGAVLGRVAPEPTEPGRTGRPRLSARFVEWMMGLPAGYVTDHCRRNDALRILGNGVVPAQGARALGLLLARERERPPLNTMM